MGFSQQIFEKYSNINFMKIGPVGTESSHTDGHEAHSRFPTFCERPLKNGRRDLWMYPHPCSIFRQLTYLVSCTGHWRKGRNVISFRWAHNLQPFWRYCVLRALRGMDLNCVRFEIQHLELIDLDGTNFTISSRFRTALIFSLTPGHKQTCQTIPKNDVGTITWNTQKQIMH